MKKPKLDPVTLDVLLKEAAANHRSFTRAFEKHDNSDDMHAMNTWDEVVRWIEGKL